MTPGYGAEKPKNNEYAMYPWNLQANFHGGQCTFVIDLGLLCNDLSVFAFMALEPLLDGALRQKIKNN